MTLITFMSDFGTVDHYVAAVKAAILSASPSQAIVDISHDIRPFDISHASNVLKRVFMDFPKGTVHLVAVDSVREPSKPIALEISGHLFVGFDCGLFSLLSNDKPDKVVLLPNLVSTFPVRDQLAGAALRLASGELLMNVGTAYDGMVELFSRQLKITKREIVGHIVSVDRYGNLMTNILKSEFDKILNLNGMDVWYVIRFGREEFRQFHHAFTDVESGDCFVLFTSTGQLQIGINKGNAAELLGLSIDAPVLIEFLND